MGGFFVCGNVPQKRLLVDMKKALLTVALLASAISSRSQGTIWFFSGNQILMPDGRTGVGPGYNAGLFLATDRNTPIATTTFLTAGGEGYLNPVKVVVPGFPIGSSNARFVLRIWEPGKTWDTSTIRGGYDGTANVEAGTGFTGTPLGGARPGGLEEFNDFAFIIPSFAIQQVPEPSTYALAGLGLGALAIMRHRK